MTEPSIVLEERVHSIVAFVASTLLSALCVRDGVQYDNRLDRITHLLFTYLCRTNDSKAFRYPRGGISMTALDSSKLIFAYISLLSLVKPVHLENSQNCEWCVPSDGKSCSGASPCHVQYYQDEDFGKVNKSKCFEIQDFGLKRVYGNSTKENVFANDACTTKIPPSELGIQLLWTVKEEYLRYSDHFTISISKIYITEECSTTDLIKIATPKLIEPESHSDVLFRFVYKGSEGLFCLNYGVSYTISINTGKGCVSSKASTMFPGNICEEESPTNNRVSTTLICLLSLILFMVMLVGIIYVKMRKRRNNEDCELEANVLLLLNPQISEGQLMERMNIIATRISRLPGINVDCNFWNRSQSQYDWVNNALQKVDIVVIVCNTDRTDEPTNENFDCWIRRLLTGNFSREIMIVHPPDVHHHERCPFKNGNYHVTRIYGDAERDTELLKTEIWKIAKSKPIRREARPLIDRNGEVEAVPTRLTSV